MIIKNEDIAREWTFINDLLQDELNRTVPTNSFIVEDFTDYLAYLNKRINKGMSAERPDHITRYINAPPNVVQ